MQREGTSNTTGVLGDENYQDSDNAENHSSESESEGDAGKGEKIKPKRKRASYLRHQCSSDADLVPEMLFKDKKKAKEAIDNYEIMKGYHLKFTKSDRTRIQCHCL